MRILRRFAGRAGYALALRVAWALISFAGAALLARWFSTKDYGNYAAVISLVSFLAVVCALGTPNALIRLLAEYGEGKQAGLARGVLNAARGGALAASLGAALILALGAVGLHWAGIVPEPAIYVAAALILPAFTLIDVQGAAARTYGRIFTALGPRDVLWRLLLIPLAWVVASRVAPGDQLVVFLLAAAASLTALALVQAWSLRRATPPDLLAAAADYRLRDWAKISAATWVTQMASAVFRTIDVVIAGIFLPPREVGLYFAASRVAALISFVLTSTNMILGPEVARLHHAGAHAELTRTLKLASLMIFLPSLLAFVVCVLFAEQVLGLFGAGFSEARPQLLILAVGQLANSAAGCVGLVLMMTGLERKNAEVLVTTSLATVAAMAVLTPLYGTLGTAVAASGGLIVWNLRLWLVARRHTAYDPSVLGLFRLA